MIHFTRSSSCRGSPDRMNILGMNYIPGTFIGIQNLANQILRWPHTNYCFEYFVQCIIKEQI